LFIYQPGEETIYFATNEAEVLAAIENDPLYKGSVKKCEIHSFEQPYSKTITA
jgi:hypothetical protein